MFKIASIFRYFLYLQISKILSLNMFYLLSYNSLNMCYFTCLFTICKFQYQASARARSLSLLVSFDVSAIFQKHFACAVIAHEKLIRNTLELIIYVGQSLCQNKVLHRHVCIVFLRSPLITILKLPNCFSHEWLTFSKTLLLVSYARIQ